MTTSNIILLVVLVCSIPLVVWIIKSSNKKVNDLDGLGEIVTKERKKGVFVAQI